ncbi:MAG: precorrin-3B synthase [Devosia sp.]
MTQLHLASPAPDIIRGKIRGACPTLREPMATGDGLLARLRPVGGAISPIQFQAVATLAARYGNGQIEITARGNLQVRGLRAATVADFATAIEAIMAIETGLPIELSPLASLDPEESTDARPLAAAIRAAIAGSTAADRLNPKVTVVLDSGGAWHRRELAGDIRLTATAEGHKWRLAIGDRPLGLLYDRDVVSATLIVLSMIAAVNGRGRDIDPAAVRERLHGLLLSDTTPPGELRESSPLITPLTDGRVAAAIWLPFGAVRTNGLDDLATAALRCGITEFRLAPHHGLLAVCASADIAGQFRDRAAALGLVTAPDDARRAISACIGTDGCGSGQIASRQWAEAAARAEPAFFDGSFALHISGCAKGCAHPATALLTLVGSQDGATFALNGRASAPPALSLPAETIPVAIANLATLWRDNRGLGESVASCFKRLGAARIVAVARQG